MTPKEDLTIKLNHIILIQGFQHRSMVDLAKKAGVSRAKLYQNFKNKADIVTAVVDRHLAFVRQYPVPATVTPANLLATLLNACLLMGSSTDRFDAELPQSYPQLARAFTQAYDGYLADLLTYYRQAQALGLLTSQVSADYVLFQQQLTVRGLLQRVEAGELSLEQGEAYLKDGFTLQVHALVVDQTLTASADVLAFEHKILQEYYETYSLV